MTQYGAQESIHQLSGYMTLITGDSDNMALHLSELFNAFKLTPTADSGYTGAEGDEDAKGLWQIEQLGRLVHAFCHRVAQERGLAQAHQEQDRIFVDVLAKRPVAQALPPQQNPLVPVDSKQAVLDVSSLTDKQLLCLLFQLYHERLPEPIEVKWCSEQTTLEEIHIFFGLVRLYTDRQFALIGVNLLPHELQEALTALQLKLASQVSGSVVYITVRRNLLFAVLFTGLMLNAFHFSAAPAPASRQRSFLRSRLTRIER
jgi:hypothetical protein